MNGVMNSHPVTESPNSVVPEGVNSLVRGAETGLLQQVLPLVHRQSVSLDLGRVERIDAAGIAALITLYRAARGAGRRFGVTNPTPHVREILMLVGLDRFLMLEDQDQHRSPEPEMAESVA
jgi:anti-anti-sigma factor